MHRPSAEEAQQSLRDHVVTRATEARLKRAGLIDRETILQMLQDRSVVRYPVGVRFDAEPLLPGEFACLEALGSHPSEGFCLYIHPEFEPVDDLLPLLIAYYIPAVNYGEVASLVEAELFGATLTGMHVEEYYKILCSVADSVPPPAGAAPRDPPRESEP